MEKSFINWPILGRSFKEVFVLSFIAFLPLVISIVIVALQQRNFGASWSTNVVPGEIVAFSLSFVAAPLWLILDTHSKIKLPYITFVFVGSIGIYVLTLVLYLALKNKWEWGVDMNPHPMNDLYSQLALGVLAATYILWVYSVYQKERGSDYGSNRQSQQENFNTAFLNSINQNPPK